MHILHMHQPEIRDTSRWPESPRRRREPDLAWNMSHYWRVMCDNSMTCDVWHNRDTRHWAVASRGLWLMPSACGLGTLQISDKIAIDPRVGSMWRQAAAVIRSWHTGLWWLLLHRGLNRVVNHKRSICISQSQRNPLLGPSPGWKWLLALSHLRHYAFVMDKNLSVARQ